MTTSPQGEGSKKMQFSRTMWSALALMAMGVCSGQALATVGPATLSDRGLEINRSLKLDVRSLMAMRSGQTVVITFPVIGRKTVVFETTTKGKDGLSYWHGSLQGNPRDHVYLKQTKDGFVGAVRFGGRQVPFRQQANGALVRVAGTGPIQGQASILGAQVEVAIA